MAMNISSSYIPQPFEMTCQGWTITSPAPSIEAGKMLAAYVEIQSMAMEQAQAGGMNLEDMQQRFNLTDEEAMRLMLGEAQVERLTREGCPALVLMHSTMCAIYYWAYGGSEDAVRMYLAAATLLNEDGDPKDEIKNHVLSLIGLNTESASPSPTENTESRSMPTMPRQKSRKKRRKARG